MSETTVRLRVSSRIEWIDPVETLARELAELLSFDEAQRFDIALAVREALSNAVIHGNGRVPSKNVYLSFGFNAESLIVRVRDEGAGFRVEDIPDPTKIENLLKPSGRGVLYIRNLMDEVDFSRAEQRGGEFVMVKLLEKAE